MDHAALITLVGSSSGLLALFSGAWDRLGLVGWVRSELCTLEHTECLFPRTARTHPREASHSQSPFLTLALLQAVQQVSGMSESL